MDVSTTITFADSDDDSAFVLMSFEYGLSSALNAVGFMHTMKVALKEVGINIPEEYFSTNIY